MKARSRSRLLRVAIAVTILVAVGFLVNKRPDVTENDRIFINAFMKEWGLPQDPAMVHQSFENELAFIRTMHNQVIDGIVHSYVKSLDSFGSVELYYRKRQGFCYDRTVLIEKILDHYDFKYRHVYAYYSSRSDKTSFADLFRKGTYSHALTEVKTKRGWMLIDGNEKWLGIDQAGNLLTMKEVGELNRQHQKTPMKLEGPQTLLINVHSFQYLYGVYSRHGNCFAPRIGVPDVNFRQLLYNL